MQARVFVKHPDLLGEMLLLRLQGWSRYALAQKYEADKTTIEHWCEKFDIKPAFQGETPARQVTVITFTPVSTTKTYKYQHLFDEEDKVPRVTKTYVQIRVEARKRELQKLGVI
jgi:hypothetical protein